MFLYEEIILLTHFFKGKWVVENVISYYKPLIKPFECGLHYYWSNFHIKNIKIKNRCHNGTIEELQKFKGFNLEKYTKIDKIKTLRNCVEPKLGLHVFECGIKVRQKSLF